MADLRARVSAQSIHTDNKPHYSQGHPTNLGVLESIFRLLKTSVRDGAPWNSCRLLKLTDEIMLWRGRHRDQFGDCSQLRLNHPPLAPGQIKCRPCTPPASPCTVAGGVARAVLRPAANPEKVVALPGYKMLPTTAFAALVRSDGVVASSGDADGARQYLRRYH